MTQTTDADPRDVIFNRVVDAILDCNWGLKGSEGKCMANAAIVALLQALADGSPEKDRAAHYLALCGWLRR